MSPRPVTDDTETDVVDCEMGCASSQANHGSLTNPGDGTTTSIEPVKYPPAEAFVIPLDDNLELDPETKEDSLIKKHPPKRLQRLTEQPAMPTTIEDLEEKLAKADIRRQKYLQQRVDTVASITGIPKIKDMIANQVEDENVDGGVKTDTETSTNKDND